MDFSSLDRFLVSLAVLYYFIGRDAINHLFPSNPGRIAPLGATEGTLPVYVLCAIAAGVHIAGRRSVQKHRDAAARRLLEAVLGDGGIRFCLYLRPFAITNKLPVEQESVGVHQRTFRDAFGGPPEKIDFEAMLADALEGLPPLVGLGRPGEAIGAGRMRTDDERWQDEILALMERAVSIFIVPSSRPGTLWELQQIRDRGYLGKTIFVLPVAMSRVVWRSICERLAQDDFHWQLVGAEEVSDARRGWLGLLDGPVASPALFTLDNEGKVNCVSNLQKTSGGALREAILKTLEGSERPPLSVESSFGGGSTKGATDIIVCPHCRTRIVPMNSGECPSCRRRVDDTLVAAVEHLPSTATLAYRALTHRGWKRALLSATLHFILLIALMLMPFLLMVLAGYLFYS